MDSRSPEARRVEALVACGMATGLAVVLHFFRPFMLPMGGSVTLGTALPIWVVARRYGLAHGVATGFATGAALFMLQGKAVHPVSPVLDYLLAYAMLGLAALTPRATVGAVISMIARYAVHVTSGVLFYSSFAPPALDPLAYSMLYNLTLLPDMAIALGLLAALQSRAPELIGSPPPPPPPQDAPAVKSWLFAGPVVLLVLGIGAMSYAMLTIRGALQPPATPPKTQAPPSPGR